LVQSAYRKEKTKTQLQSLDSGSRRCSFSDYSVEKRRFTKTAWTEQLSALDCYSITKDTRKKKVRLRRRNASEIIRTISEKQSMTPENNICYKRSF